MVGGFCGSGENFVFGVNWRYRLFDGSLYVSDGVCVFCWVGRYFLLWVFVVSQHTFSLCGIILPRRAWCRQNDPGCGFRLDSRGVGGLWWILLKLCGVNVMLDEKFCA